MEERCGPGFKREGGLRTGGLMRKGSLVSGQALSNRRGQYSLPKTSKHINVHVPLDPNPISWSPAPAYLSSYLRLSVSRRNQPLSWSSLSVLELKALRSHQDSSPAASGLKLNPVESQSLPLLLAAWFTALFTDDVSRAIFPPSAVHQNNEAMQ